jgi:hypothetical protein
VKILLAVLQQDDHGAHFSSLRMQLRVQLGGHDAACTRLKLIGVGARPDWVIGGHLHQAP